MCILARTAQCKDILWSNDKLSESMELKRKGIIGPQKSDLKQMRVLNRVVTWTDEGLFYEPDQRHAEIIVSQMDPAGHGLLAERRRRPRSGIAVRGIINNINIQY